MAEHTHAPGITPRCQFVFDGADTVCTRCHFRIVGQHIPRLRKACTAAIGPKSWIGTHLSQIIKRETSALPCTACNELIDKMDNMTPEEVTEQKSQLAAQIVRRARQRAPKWWQRWAAYVAPNMATARVEAWINEALVVAAASEPRPHRR